MADQDTPTTTPWIERASSVRLLCRLLFVISACLFLPDVLAVLHIGYHKHVHYSAESWLGFYAFFVGPLVAHDGIGAFVAGMLLAVSIEGYRRTRC